MEIELVEEKIAQENELLRLSAELHPLYLQDTTKLEIPYPDELPF